jgi:23S rRNA pseudouridine1911/1915/1917 synthase
VNTPPIIYEDRDLIAVNKTIYIRVAADESEKESLELVVKDLIAGRAADSGRGTAGKPVSPGAAPSPPGGPEPVGPAPFLGLVHRLDQPVTGVVLFAKNPEALRGMNEIFQGRRVKKIYWAVTDAPPPAEAGTLEHYLSFNPGKNKSYAHSEAGRGGKKAVLRYRLAGKTDRYFLVEIELVTGRHHQIRAQLSAAGCHIKGDLKYGASRSDPGGGIHLHARSLGFVHPISGAAVEITAPPPEDPLWSIFSAQMMA